MTSKAELENKLLLELEALENLLDRQPSSLFATHIIPGKWSTGQHIHHLLLSTKLFHKALCLPRLFLKYKFGTNNRKERTFEDLKTRYKTELSQSTVKPPKSFQPREIRDKDKEQLIAQFRKASLKLNKNFKRWKEKDLGHYILPHPLLGMLTIREMFYFTIIHMEHHRHILEKRYITG
jgi:hypothetical protein